MQEKNIDKADAVIHVIHGATYLRISSKPQHLIQGVPAAFPLTLLNLRQNPDPPSSWKTPEGSTARAHPGSKDVDTD
jgi:hypothetical protein